MSNKLAWWPFFVDAFMGGTLAMSQAEIGCYVLMLNAQWQSGELCAIKVTESKNGAKNDQKNDSKNDSKNDQKNDSKNAPKLNQKMIRNICKGKLHSSVLEKFTLIWIDGAWYLRNLKLAEVYKKQHSLHSWHSSSGKLGAQLRWSRSTQCSTDSHGYSMANGMPDSMSDGMPDSMSDGMPDSMSDGISREERLEEGSSPSVGRSTSSPHQSREAICSSSVGGDWLKKLEGNPTYAHLDFQYVYSKLVDWCEEHQKPLTRKRILSWFNSERGTRETNGSSAHRRETPSETNLRNIQESINYARSLAEHSSEGEFL